MIYPSLGLGLGLDQSHTWDCVNILCITKYINQVAHCLCLTADFNFNLI